MYSLRSDRWAWSAGDLHLARGSSAPPAESEQTIERVFPVGPAGPLSFFALCQMQTLVGAVVKAYRPRGLVLAYARAGLIEWEFPPDARYSVVREPQYGLVTEIRSYEVLSWAAVGSRVFGHSTLLRWSVRVERGTVRPGITARQLPWDSSSYLDSAIFVKSVSQGNIFVLGEVSSPFHELSRAELSRGIKLYRPGQQFLFEIDLARNTLTVSFDSITLCGTIPGLAAFRPILLLSPGSCATLSEC